MARDGLSSQDELANQVEALAVQAGANQRLGERYIILSVARLIRSNERVEKNIDNLINQLRVFNGKAEQQTKRLVNLTWVIAGITAVLAFLAIVTLIKH